MKLPSIPFLASSFLAVLKRFPLVMSTAILGVVIAMIIIEVPYDEEEFYAEILMAIALALPLMLSAAIFSEKKKLAGVIKWLPHLAAAILAIGYYFTVDLADNNLDEKMAIRFVGLLSAAHLLVSFVAYLDKSSIDDFWEYNRQLFTNFISGAFYCLIVFAGLSIAILAVDNLFDLDVDDEVYGHLFVFIAGVINTAYFLFQFPEKYNGISNDSLSLNRAFINFTKFILIPIVAVYFLILYAYSFKILGAWELPKGWVSSLVLGFSVAGIFTYLLNYLLKNYDENKLIHRYRKWFFFVLAPMVILLFIAIGRRLLDYGVTEPRYIVATLGAWLFVVSLYFIISKKDNIKFIPISLAFIVLFSVVGPWNLFKVSQKSQIGRLEGILLNNNMLENEKVISPTTSLTSEDAENIQSILNYLRSHGYFTPVASWFDLEEDPSYAELNEKLAGLGLEDAINAMNNRYCNIYFDRPVSYALAEDYDELIFPQIEMAEGAEVEGWAIRKIPETNFFELIENGAIKDSLDLTGYLNLINEKYDCESRDFERDDSFYKIEGQYYNITLITEWMDYRIENGIKMGSWRGVVLLQDRQ